MSSAACRDPIFFLCLGKDMCERQVYSGEVSHCLLVFDSFICKGLYCIRCYHSDVFFLRIFSAAPYPWIVAVDFLCI